MYGKCGEGVGREEGRKTFVVCKINEKLKNKTKSNEDVRMHLKKDTQQNVTLMSNSKFYEYLKNCKWNKKNHKTFSLILFFLVIYFFLSYFKNYIYLPI